MKQQTTVNYCTVLGELKTNDGGHQCSVSTELIQEGSTLDTAAAKSRQLCPTLCDPIDGSPPGSPVPGILQARTLEWLPFPSPMHEREKWKWSRSVASDSLRPHGLQPTRFFRPWEFPGKSTGVGLQCLLHSWYYYTFMVSLFWLLASFLSSAVYF